MSKLNESLNPLVHSHIYFLEALLSDRIAMSFPPNSNTKWILDLDEYNYINKDKKEADLDDDDDDDKHQYSSHENTIVLAPKDFVLYQFPSRPCLAFFQH